MTIPVRAGRGVELEALLVSRRREMQQALRAVSTLHFGRFVALPPRQGKGDGLLTIETNFDGDLEPHLAERGAATAPLLTDILSMCEGWPAAGTAADLATLAREAGRRTSAFYVAHPGLGAARIQADARLRSATEALLDRERS